MQRECKNLKGWRAMYRRECENMAWTYYQAVNKMGDGPYKQCQDACKAKNKKK